MAGASDFTDSDENLREKGRKARILCGRAEAVTTTKKMLDDMKYTQSIG